LLIRYLNYLLKARSAYSIHSPFVYQLYTEVIRSSKEYYAYAEIEAFRQYLLENKTVIEVQDFGAGSRVHTSKRRSIQTIAMYSLAPAKEAQLLFRLVNHFQPKVIVELGTSLGITTLYLSKAFTKSKIYTFEGCPSIAQIAQNQFEALQAHNITLNIGKLENTLSEVVKGLATIDFAYLDANHRYQPTMDYWDILSSKFHEDTLIVVDDIHWSTEMQKAWEAIKLKPEVSITIDLFGLGLVFLKKNIVKQDFVLWF
jgi:predicted O-methyltransferase YrrM